MRQRHRLIPCGDLNSQTKPPWEWLKSHHNFLSMLCEERENSCFLWLFPLGHSLEEWALILLCAVVSVGLLVLGSVHLMFYYLKKLPVWAFEWKIAAPVSCYMRRLKILQQAKYKKTISICVIE